MNHKQQSETSLEQWEAMRRGERDAFAWLYQRYFHPLFRYGKRLGFETGSEEDSIHDLFVDLWRLRSNLSPTSSVKFYLYRSLRRRLVRGAAANALFVRDEMHSNDIPNITCAPSETEIIEAESRTHQHHIIGKGLRDLPPRQYEILVLRFYDNFTFREIAAILDINEQSVRNLVQRALAKLRRSLRYPGIASPREVAH